MCLFDGARFPSLDSDTLHLINSPVATDDNHRAHNNNTIIVLNKSDLLSDAAPQTIVLALLYSTLLSNTQ